jgi:hypothetical protein
MMATIDLRIFELDMKQNYLKKNNNVCCETSFVRWYQFSWFLQNALIPGFLNSRIQILHATINRTTVFCWILICVVLVNHEIHENKNLTNNNNFTVFYSRES